MHAYDTTYNTLQCIIIIIIAYHPKRSGGMICFELCYLAIVFGSKLILSAEVKQLNVF